MPKRGRPSSSSEGKLLLSNSLNVLDEGFAASQSGYGVSDTLIMPPRVKKAKAASTVILPPLSRKERRLAKSKERKVADLEVCLYFLSSFSRFFRCYNCLSD